MGRAARRGWGGQWTEEIINAFGESSEYTDHFGGLGNGQLIDALYQQVFGRAAEPQGKAYWLGRLASGELTLAEAALEVINGAQDEDLTTLNNKLVAADAFIRVIDPELDGQDLQATYDADDLTVARGWLGRIDAAAAVTLEQVFAHVCDNIANPGDPILDNVEPPPPPPPPPADTTAPVVTSGQTFSYAENRAANAELGTVTATDNTAVTGFAIVSGNDNDDFAIDSAGKITLTLTGAAAASNDFETGENSFTLGIVATDAAGNRSEAVNVTLKVTDVEDETAPTLLNSTPADDAGEVSPTNTLTLTFSETVVLGNSGTITVKHGSNDDGTMSVDVTDAANFSINNDTVTVTLPASLAGGVDYSVQITAGAFKDAAGNAFAGISDAATLNFTSQNILTTNAYDTLTGTGGGDVFLATSTTLQATDTIDGGGNDYLGVRGDAAVSLELGTNITNTESVNARNLSAGGLTVTGTQNTLQGIEGSDQADTIDVTPGSDGAVIYGRSGGDTITLHAGKADMVVFSYSASANGADTIRGFESGANHKLDMGRCGCHGLGRHLR